MLCGFLGCAYAEKARSSVIVSHHVGVRQLPSEKSERQHDGVIHWTQGARISMASSERFGIYARSFRWWVPRFDWDLGDVCAVYLIVVLRLANVSCVYILIGIPNLTCGQDVSRYDRYVISMVKMPFKMITKGIDESLDCLTLLEADTPELIGIERIDP